MGMRKASQRGCVWITIAGLIALAVGQQQPRILPEEGVVGTPVALVTEPGGDGVVSVVTPEPGQPAVGAVVAEVETTSAPATVHGFPGSEETVAASTPSSSEHGATWTLGKATEHGAEAHEEFVHHGEGEHAEGAEAEGGEHHGEEHHGEEEEEEGPASPTAVAIGATLLAAIGFQMILFYMTNHHDKDMRKYTYQVLSNTISIFCAVLIFFEVHDGLDLLLERMDWKSERVELVANFVHMLAWNIILQLALAFFAGIFHDKELEPEHIVKALERQELNLGCFAVLLAHITGFASIHAWCNLQQAEMFRQSPLSALSVVPLAIVGQLILQFIFKTIRDKVNLSDDGIEDQYEKQWDEETADAEDDVMGLAVSFAMAQALRFYCGGVLPNAEGVESEHALTTHTQAAMIRLVLASWACIAVVFLLSFLAKASDKYKLVARLVKVIRGSAAMSFAWCFFFSAKWFLAHRFADQMLVTVTEALCISMLAFGSIRILDYLADADWTGPETDAAIFQVIGANGLLVGFAWEQSFDKAIEAVASVMAPDMQHLVKLVLAVGCVCLIVPAWRWYILPMEKHEGWDLGFIVNPDDHEKMAYVLQNERFKKMAEHPSTKEAHEKLTKKLARQLAKLRGAEYEDTDMGSSDEDTEKDEP